MKRGTLAALLALLLSCGIRSPGTVSGGGGGEDGEGPSDREVETFATPLVVTAGEMVSVNCVVRRGGVHQDGAETTVGVSPDAGPINAVDGGFTFHPTSAGEYLLRCATIDGGARDERGVHVTVEPGTPAIITTALEMPTAAAGVPVGVNCAAFDDLGNEIEDALFNDLDVQDGLWVDPPSGAQLIVRGTLVGDYTVGCALDVLIDDTPTRMIDETPELLTIVPGVPANSETTVDASDVTPGETVNVSCEVFDEYGNAIPGVSTTVSALAADGSDATVTGLTTGNDTVSATTSGDYYVFCRVRGELAGDESPAVVTVHWGLPCTWLVEWPDPATCYWQGRRLPVDYTVWDQWGNRVEDASADLAANPSTGVVPDGDGGFLFTEEGTYDLSLSMPGPHDPACAALPDTTAQPALAGALVTVDSTPPIVNITSPTRAAMISQGTLADATVTIDGTVSDTASAVTDLELLGNVLVQNGTTASEPFATSQTSRWGVNIITGWAMDECGNRREVAQSYLRGQATDGYYNAAISSNAGAQVDRGVLAHLNQPVIDDGDRGAPIDDLVTIIQLILDDLDWNTLLPAGTAFGEDPNLRSSCSGWPWEGSCNWTDTSYWVGRPNNAEQIGGAIVVNSLTAVNGGMTFDIDLNNLSLPIRASACARECAVCIRATQCTGDIDFRVDGSVASDGTLAISQSSGAASVSIPTLNVNVSNLEVNNLDLFDCGVLDFICDPIENLVESIINAALDAFESQVETLISDELRAALPSTVEDFLNGFGLDTGFDLPAPLAVTVTLESSLDRVQFSGPAGSGYGQLGLWTQMYPSAHHQGASALGDTIPVNAGAIRKDNSVSGCCLPSFASTYDFGLGLKDDLINQLLWSMWYGGALDLDLAELGSVGGIDPSVLNIQLFARLPPVLMPGTDGNQVDIGLGDAYVDATVDLAALIGGDPGTTPPLHVGMYLSTIIGGSLGLDPVPNELLVALDNEPTVFVEVVVIDDDGYQGTMTQLFTQLLQLVMPALFEAAIGSFPVPDFDLGGVGGLPAGTVLRLTNGSIGRGGSQYFRLTGSLTQPP